MRWNELPASVRRKLTESPRWTLDESEQRSLRSYIIQRPAAAMYAPLLDLSSMYWPPHTLAAFLGQLNEMIKRDTAAQLDEMEDRVTRRLPPGHCRAQVHWDSCVRAIGIDPRKLAQRSRR